MHLPFIWAKEVPQHRASGTSCLLPAGKGTGPWKPRLFGPAILAQTLWGLGSHIGRPAQAVFRQVQPRPLARYPTGP